MRPHEKLRTWVSIDLVLNIYRATESFPEEEKFGLASQIRRAAVSVPVNIAEGAGRFSAKEFVHFVSNAQRSASELETELIIAHRLGYLTESSFVDLLNDLERIGRMITGLSRRLRTVPA